MKTTSNLGLKKIELTDSPPDITVQDDNWDKIDKHLNTAVKFVKASGTGTAITLTEVTLEDGYQKTFIVSANNNSAATKINGKNLYKPGTTTAPNLITGKAVTVWYDVTGDCFFIKASAEGNAVADKVLAGVTFSNDNDTGLTGTMVDNGSVGTKNLITEGAEYTIPKGYHNGLGKVKAVITGLLASVIKAGTTVGGIVGTYTSDATATASQIVNGASAYVKGNKVTGTMPNVGAIFSGPAGSDAFDTSGIMGAANNEYVGAFDYNMGSPTAYLESANGVFRTHIPNLTPGNIKMGAKVGGKNGYIEGTFTSDGNVWADIILKDKICYSQGQKIVGSGTDYRSAEVTDGWASNLSNYTIQGSVYGRFKYRLNRAGVKMKGFVDDTTVNVDIWNLLPGNIKKGVSIGNNSVTTGNVVGTYEGESKYAEGSVGVWSTMNTSMGYRAWSNTYYATSGGANLGCVNITNLGFTPKMLVLSIGGTTNMCATVTLLPQSANPYLGADYRVVYSQYNLQYPLYFKVNSAEGGYTNMVIVNENQVMLPIPSLYNIDTYGPITYRAYG